jgi:hypothetical protein
MPSNTPHEYGCEDCDLLYHGIPVITDLGEALCVSCAADRAELIEADPYEFDDDYGDVDLFDDLICDDPTEA